MPRFPFLVEFNDEVHPVDMPMTRELCYQNNLLGAGVPEVFGFRIDDQSGAEHDRIIDRVIAYFHHLNDSYDLAEFVNDDMWGDSPMADHHRTDYREFEEALLDRDRASVSATLRDVCNTSLISGFYSSDISEATVLHEHGQKRVPWQIFDALVSIASAFGYPVHNPEQGAFDMSGVDFEDIVEFVLDHVPALRYAPRAGGGIFGIRTRNGVLAWRDLVAAFNATRVQANLDGLPRKIAEIGGGMGGLAYFLARAGVSVSAFDIPMVSLLQSYFLMTSLGSDAVWIHGEDARPAAKVRVQPWWEFQNTADDEFSLVVNVDSLPEIQFDVALNYVDMIHAKSSHHFLSINQESGAANTNSDQNVVGDLVAIRGGFTRTYRFPYWLRPGYVEELYTILK